MEEKEIGMYIHMPFCRQRCYYCDFTSYADKYDRVARYIKCLKKEIVQYANENRIMSEHGLEPQYVINTIYIGGGTPSSINEEYIIDVLDTIKGNFKVKNNAEITIEVNPGTVDRDKLEAYKHCGINRLSIGLQAVQDEILKRIGRIHTYKEFKDTYYYARESGFDNINVDLMIDLPDQTIDDVKESVKEILSLKPEHISVYSLILEQNTKMYEMISSKIVSIAPDEIERQMYWYVKRTLEKHKYNHYEISNFALAGFESRHNMNCWNQQEYIGVGVSASSFMENKRYSNTQEIETYIDNIEKGAPNRNLILEETLDKESKMNEFMMLGLRKITGVDIRDFEKTFKVNPIMRYCRRLEKLNHEGLIEIDANNIKLTSKGIDLANLVWEEFV